MHACEAILLIFYQTHIKLLLYEYFVKKTQLDSFRRSTELQLVTDTDRHRAIAIVPR